MPLNIGLIKEAITNLDQANKILADAQAEGKRAVVVSTSNGRTLRIVKAQNWIEKFTGAVSGQNQREKGRLDQFLRDLNKQSPSDQTSSPAQPSIQERSIKKVDTPIAHATVVQTSVTTQPVQSAEKAEAPAAAPQVQASVVPQVQASVVPQVQASVVPQVQASVVPQVQASVVPQVQTAVVPQVQASVVPQVQASVKLIEVSDVLAMTKPEFNDWMANQIKNQQLESLWSLAPGLVAKDNYIRANQIKFSVKLALAEKALSLNKASLGWTDAAVRQRARIVATKTPDLTHPNGAERDVCAFSEIDRRVQVQITAIEAGLIRDRILEY